MAFELEHDWQGNMATPRAHVGERVKARLLIVLCIVWVCLGLIGHDPWKPDESQAISIVKAMMSGNGLLTPVPVGQSGLDNPPLYYWSAAGMAKLLFPLLPIHDAARLVTGLWMALTLLMVGMTGRELWGRGTGRQTTLVFIGSLGLVITAHLLMPEVAALTGSAMGLYALALAKRRPYRASLLLGSSIAIGFLSTGLLTAAITIATALLLPLLFSNWRNKSYAIVLLLSALIASPWLFGWAILCWQASPELFNGWWQASIHSFNNHNHVYFLRTLGWYALPALPLALWSLWRYRAYVLNKPKFQLLIIFFSVGLLLIGFGADSSEIYALPLLLPLAALAGGSIETLKRGAAGLLNWFGLMLFGAMGFLIWLGWIAMMTGWPAKLNERMQVLSGTDLLHFHWLAFIAALAISLTWLLVVNNSRHSNRAAVTDWAVGITMTWSLLMVLWLPWIDSAKSYRSVMTSMASSMPTNYACVNSRNLGSSQAALLDYYTSIRTQPFEIVQRIDCDLYLIQDERGREKIEPGSDWKLIWQGKRPAERHESFRLFQHH
jgi:4-amino-4-deoxy-L-arabinose transferase-like glycosyltransferase